MKNSLVHAIQFTLAILVASVGAQAAEQASFHLPVEAHLGSNVLKPGDYKMSLPEVAFGEFRVRIVGADKTVSIFPQITDSASPAKSSYFELTQIGGQYYIRAFNSSVSGKAFVFNTPKRAHQDDKVIVLKGI